MSEKFFPESPEHLTALAMDSNLSTSRAGMDEQQRIKPLDLLRLSKTFERLHGLTPSEGRARARSSVATRLRDSELMASISELGGDDDDNSPCSRKYWWAIILALGVTSGFALSASMPKILLLFSTIPVSRLFLKYILLSYFSRVCPVM